ncbi:MAG TPA: aldo/keto reductase [bacterium]|nr:aldo/keto reductase [bacterium]HOL34808.1 aldo/keto reductase [bacterium]HPP08249.1 aldo/keto reductase [bacterium]
MEYTELGKTGLRVSRIGFGALPIQRTELKRAVRILHVAFDHGINFFDTARSYTDSEKKIGIAFKGKRNKIILATKLYGKNKKDILSLLEESLKQLQTDYVDILQLHNPQQLPDPDDKDSQYTGLIEAQKKGMARFIGITAHKLTNAIATIESGFYDTLQYPFSMLSSKKEIELIELAKKHHVGLIAMKPLCGGLLADIETSFAFLWQFENLVPVWGIQRMKELNQIINLSKSPPPLDAELRKKISEERKLLGSSFCRGCGYCLPCPADIPIPMAARMKYLLRRAPYRKFLTVQWQKNMLKIEHCKNCEVCKCRCPYGLNVPELLNEMLSDYIDFAKTKGIIIERTKGNI